MSDGPETASLGEFTFECGESIPDLEIAYEAYGEFTGDNAVLVCHALTGSAHVAGGRRRTDTAGQAHAWWDDIVGPGKAVDTTDYYVVCANIPGSCYGSSGPPTIDPETGEPWGTRFPAVTVTDWTRAQRRLLDHLGIPNLHAVVGGSVGGMNVLEWAKRHPDHADRVVVIAAAARLDPQCLALDAIAQRAITTDPKWNGGDYYGSEPPTEGLALARQIGHVMYLSKSSMDDKFGRRSAGMDAGRDTFQMDPAAGFFPYREVESYLDYQGEKFATRFDANSYLYLTRAMDNYDLASGYDDDADALAAFDGEALLLSFTGDWHFTVEQSEALAASFRETDADTAHHVIDSDHGHDAFLVEPDRVGPPVADFLEDGIRGKAVSDTVETDEGDEFAPVHTSLFSD
ncbi:MAG: homoserine O-acetyltransferase [Natronomonas sp.]|jgi:homoserine O-acetyltransferase|uniref:homoserine O-acetyltransferase MetX n=1 Tax=Natronomonas sp. TaxID=2184060 RepID=UPI0028709D69|nr:homoserine O-acetyltransferase [Natronomonas sp.]MDR9381130.1 homoserine O-acetyltransferase [Natronomonas sp.]MDR9430046.1 homoserine O-acetyltransferase [Natronomonas sp.]